MVHSAMYDCETCDGLILEAGHLLLGWGVTLIVSASMNKSMTPNISMCAKSVTKAADLIDFVQTVNRSKSVKTV